MDDWPDPSDPEMVRKLREFCEVASLKCSCCDELGQITIDTGRRRVTRTAAHYGIKSLGDWERKVDEYLEWARSNRESVVAAMRHLPDWKETCDAIRQVLESS